MNAIGQVLDPRHYLILIGKDIVKHRRAVFGHSSGPCRHGQGDTRLCALCVIGAVAVFGHTIFRIGRFVTCRHDPVFKGQVFKLVRLEQRIFGHLASFARVIVCPFGRGF